MDRSKSSKTVLGIDRTFNLSSLYATVTVFKNLSMVCGNTQEAPIFLGPVMLYGDGHYSTYLCFFTDLQCALSMAGCSTELRTCNSLVVGSDEEKALVKAIHEFPQCWQCFLFTPYKRQFATSHDKTWGGTGTT